LLGLTRTDYGLALLSTSASYLVGTLVCRRLLARVGLRRTVAIAGVFSACSAVGLLLAASLGWHHWGALLPPMWLFTFGHGMHQPCGQSGAVGPFPQAAGVASALNGFMMMVVGFMTGMWLGQQALGASVWPLVQAVAFWAALLALVAWTLVQRYGGHD